MRVLMIAPEPFREPRGTPISVFQRLHGLASLGHTVDLVTYHVGEEVSIPHVKIHRIPRVPFVKVVKIGPSPAKLVLDALLCWKAVTMLVTKRYEVIHSHEEAAFFAAILAFIFRTRHLYDMHSSLPRQLLNFGFGQQHPVVKMFEVLERWVITTCDAVITIGSDLEAHVKATKPGANHVRIENLPVQSTNARVDQRAVGELRQSLGLNGKLPIVYTGTFEPYQGVDLLIESAAIVREHHADVVFVLVGGKPRQVDYWKSEAKRKNLEDCIRFVGTVPVEEMPTYMELAEILVSPRTGGISVPLKIYSYLLSGKPIAATNLITHTLILDDGIAVLTAPTKESFAEGILRLIREPELRLLLGLRAKRLAEERFSPEIYLARLDGVYRSLQRSPRMPKQSSHSTEG